MELKETLKDIMNKNPNDYNMIFEIMKRKVSKGLIDGVTAQIFEDTISELTTIKEKEETPEEINAKLTRNIFELSEAINKYNYFDEDSNIKKIGTKVSSINENVLSENIVSEEIKSPDLSMSINDFLKGE